MSCRPVKGQSHLLCVGARHVGTQGWFKPGGFGHLDRTDNRDDQLWIIPEAELANLHDVVEVSGATTTMRYWPEELVVVPR